MPTPDFHNASLAPVPWHPGPQGNHLGEVPKGVQTMADTPSDIRLFKRTWTNPSPDVEIVRLDLIAEHPDAHPFLVALTVE